MSDSNPPEPSMEEILASIRRIISEDEASTGGVAVGGAAVSGAGADDVLILKDRAPPEPAPAPLPAPPVAAAPAPQVEPVSEFAQFAPIATHAPVAEPPVPPQAKVEPDDSFRVEPVVPPPEPRFEAAPDPVPPAPPRAEVPPPVAEPAPSLTPPPVSENWVVKTPEDDHAVVAQETALSAAAAFQKLSMVVDHAHATPVTMEVSAGGPTLEDITRELLRPVLKAWLDENLAGIVRERVDEEVERISRGRVR